jgi:hypothetical protein
METIVRLAAAAFIAVLLARFIAWAAWRQLRMVFRRNAATG